MCCLFSLAESRLDLFYMALVPEMNNEGTPFARGTFCFSFLRKHWSSSHCYFEPSRSHDWITNMVVFHLGNPECS
jgi:hypothetical protein